jgi:hypothetical protein
LPFHFPYSLFSFSHFGLNELYNWGFWPVLDMIETVLYFQRSSSTRSGFPTRWCSSLIEVGASNDSKCCHSLPETCWNCAVSAAELTSLRGSLLERLGEQSDDWGMLQHREGHSIKVLGGDFISRPMKLLS